MDERKEKLIAYLSKNLQIAEAVVGEFTTLRKEIDELEDLIAKKKAEFAALGDPSTAIANVDEIRGFIEDLTKPEELPEDETEEDDESCDACAIPTDEQLNNTTPMGEVTFF